MLGDADDVVDLSSLFADGHTEGQWQQGGQVTQNGHTFNVYQHSGDQTLRENPTPALKLRPTPVGRRL